MAMTQKEIDTLIEKVKTGTYTIENALKEIADSAKGKDVRKALYALAYILNQEGKAGSVDLTARHRIEELDRSYLSEPEVDKIWDGYPYSTDDQGGGGEDGGDDQLPENAEVATDEDIENMFA